MKTPSADGQLTRGAEIMLAIVGGILVANAYYIHPIISAVAADFGVSPAMIGLVPALNQGALALGIFLLLPLGDRYSNRCLAIIFAIGQTASLLIMVFAPNYLVFVSGSTILGFFTIAPYLLPAYASKRVPVERLGSVTATLTAGTIFGILMARVGAGAITRYFDWHWVYIVAAVLMIGTTIVLPFIMEGRKARAQNADRSSYAALVMSLFALMKAHPNVFMSGIIQALNFGIFLAIWLGLALYLPSPKMGYGVDIVGYLAGFAIIALFVTPRLGIWADKVGAETVRFRLSVIQMIGVFLLLPLGHSL
ncbi:MAG: MFS transporter, partial [Pontixanthobacter sp.]